MPSACSGDDGAAVRRSRDASTLAGRRGSRDAAGRVQTMPSVLGQARLLPPPPPTPPLSPPLPQPPQPPPPPPPPPPAIAAAPIAHAQL
mmetsp:Transcript_16430/g.34866  ORF Transcript_16430/g.34866 Transcript_16430/m.34866 type:complete len:89 (+) Transcript_16430:2331-2597(+)|eukprot:6172414-Pleurochrysis_carterae.AAC.1